MVQLQTRIVIFFVSLVLGGMQAAAQTGGYDAVYRTMAPFLSLFMMEEGSEFRALEAEVVLEEATGLPAGFPSCGLAVALQYPDKLLVEVKTAELAEAAVSAGLDESLRVLLASHPRIARVGQMVWVVPGTVATAWLEDLRPFPGVSKQERIGDFRLPFSAKQLAFFPALFRVQDEGEDEDGNRVLGIGLIPEAANVPEVAGLRVRLSVTPDFRPFRIEVVREKFRVVLRVKKWRYAKSLPDATWNAGETQDVLRMNAAQYRQVVRRLTDRAQEKLKGR